MRTDFKNAKISVHEVHRNAREIWFGASIATVIASSKGGSVRRATTTAIMLFILTGCRASAPPPPAIREPFTSGEQLIEAMQNRYAGRWYRTVTFVQSTTTIAADGKETKAIWYEAALLPSRLRIDYDPITAGNGALVRADSQFIMQRGTVLRSAARTNDLLLLGFDVYFLDPPFTSAWLRRIGYDLSKIRQDTWQDRPVYVVGATSPADLQSRQFWIDREHLLFLRALIPGASGQVDDIRFGKYEQIGRAWIAPLVEIHRGGKLVFKEEYEHIRIDQPLDVAMFEPASWATARHWYLDR